MVDRIEELTAEQKKLLEVRRAEWRAVGLATGAVNRDTVPSAVESVRMFYSCKTCKPGTKAKNCTSPLHATPEAPIYYARSPREALHLACDLALELKGADFLARLASEKLDKDAVKAHFDRATNLCSYFPEYVEQMQNRMSRAKAKGIDPTLSEAGRAYMIQQNLGREFWGSCEAYWVGYYRFAQELGITLTKEQNDQLGWYETLARGSFWWWTFDGSAIIEKDTNFEHGFSVMCDRPTHIKYDSRDRLHCADGSAVGFSDGFGFYLYHGVRITKKVTDRNYAAQDITAEQNAEVRRVMLELYGADKYIREAGAKLVHEDDFGQLYRLDQQNDEPIVMVKVVNSTPEPDGSYKDYWLRCHPELRPLLNSRTRAGRLAGEEIPADFRPQFGEPQALTARNAVASTFGLKGEEYKPFVET